MRTQVDAIAMYVVRIGDQERDSCIAALTEHHVRGRLSAEEFDRRHRAAMAAVTAGDLAALVADLPSDAASVGRGLRAVRRGRTGGTQPHLSRQIAVWAGPPVAIVSTSTVVMFATHDSLIGFHVLYGSVISGAVGFLSHWAVARLKRS